MTNIWVYIHRTNQAIVLGFKTDGLEQAVRMTAELFPKDIYFFEE